MLLAFIRDDPKASFADLAAKINWKLYSGEPNKMKVKRATDDMIKLKLVKKNALEEWEITETGTTLLGRKSQKTTVTAGDDDECVT